VPAVVLGLGQNGLASVRALGRRGVPVIGIDDDLARPGAHSRYCRAVHCPGFRTGGDALLAFLLDLGARLPSPAFLLPSGDLNLRLMSEHRDTLARFYRFVLPSPEGVDLALDKRAFYAFAEAHGFSVPQTRVATPDTVAEVARDARYPAILKPALREMAWRTDHGVKLYEVHSADELRARYDELSPICPDILVQELIPGPDTSLVFSLTYVDAFGEPVAMFTGRKLRQYRPRFGTSSMARSEWNPAVAETTIEILKALKYRGYGSVEFKQDPRDGQLRAIEVTARTWYPHGLATACGINLPYIAYADALGLPIPGTLGFEDGVTWIDEDRDVRSAVESIRAGSLTVRAWLGSYRGRRTYALAATDDPGPILNLARRTARAGLRRVWRRCPGRRVAATPASAGGRS
jgi:predicted ATP-grasp superfamily ATP-dependent carboligase